MSTRTRSVVRRGLVAVGVAGGATALGLALGAGTAAADETSGQDGLLSGNQSNATAEVPVEVSGNQVTVIGDGNQSDGATEPDSSPAPGAGSDAGSTSGEDGLLSGNQSAVGVDVPLDVCGNQVTVVGDANQSGGCAPSGSSAARGPADGGTTTGEDGAGSGNQTDVEVDAPVEVSGNQVTVVGDGNRSDGSTQTGRAASGSGAGGGDSTSGEDGAGSGNQTDVEVDAPVEVSGNQVTVVGDGNQSAGSTQTGGAASGSGAGGGDSTSGEDGAGSGNQTNIEGVVPVEASGNQVTVVGDGNQSDGSTQTGGAASGSGAGGGDSTSGEDGVGSGNQTPVDVLVPVEASGNQVTVVGDGNQSGGSEDPAAQDPTPGEPPGTPAHPGDPSSPGGGSGGGNGDGSGDVSGNGGVVGPAFGGGPGHPGSVVAGAGFPPASAPVAGVLPATGTSVSLTVLIGGLLLLLGGLALLRPSRRELKGGATRTT
jgi:LPXTG-motif cell wall-anchored protein